MQTNASGADESTAPPPRECYDLVALTERVVEQLRDEPETWHTAASLSRNLGVGQPIEPVRVALVTLLHHGPVTMDYDGERCWYRWAEYPGCESEGGVTVTVGTGGV